jgi:hypothetical protein
MRHVCAIWVIKGVSTAKTFIRITDGRFAAPEFSRSCVIPDHYSVGPNRVGRHWQKVQECHFSGQDPADNKKLHRLRK